MINCGSEGVRIDQIDYWKLKKYVGGNAVFSTVRDPETELLLVFRSGDRMIIESPSSIYEIMRALNDIDSVGQINW